MFGIPEPMVDMIQGIYGAKCFVIHDPCGNSSVRLQRASIAQGCPLSPYFSMLVYTILLTDVDFHLYLHGAFEKGSCLLSFSVQMSFPHFHIRPYSV